jgi:PAS domain S-box-containing protein
MKRKRELDISDRAERELSNSEEQYRLLFDANPNPMWVCDVEDFRFLAVNDAAIRHYGYSRDEFLSMTLADVHPEEVPFLDRQSELNCGKDSWSREVWKHVKKDGTAINVEISSQPIAFRGHRAILVLAHDITAILRAEAALRESREQLKSLLDSSAEAIFGLDLRGVCIFCNAAGAKMLGYDSAAALVGRDVHSMIHGVPPDTRGCSITECSLSKALRFGTSDYKSEDQFRRSDGSHLLVEYWCHPVTRDEVVVGSVLTFFDITPKRKAEEALRQTEAQFTSIIRGAPYGIYRTDSNDQLLMANPALATMLGYESEAELLRLKFASAFYSHLEENVGRSEKHAGSCDAFDGETTLTRKDGGPLTARIRGRRLHSSGEGDGYEVFVEDVTEKRHLERQLLHSQKMEVIGHLAGGVAHDFNNLLMVVNSFAELILKSSDDQVKVQNYATQIYEAGNRAAAVTRQLLAFSRSQVQDLRVLDLNTLVADWGKVIPRLLGERVEMMVSSSVAPALVYADQGQIEQVIMNLVLNARDAMPQGGRMTIATEHVHLDQAYFNAHNVHVAEGSYVMLSVADTGCGMDATTRARVFEPFFTTKERDKGTGLGLATVYGIVKQSGGFVWVYSEPNQGTIFKVYLPEARGKAQSLAKPQAAGDEPIGCETILVVEDEPGIRAVTCAYLRSKGYRVLQAPNPIEALSILRQEDRVALLVTDMIMPGGSGIELVSAIKKMGRTFPVIFMSGYAKGHMNSDGFGDEPIYLQKPFSLATLARAVRTALKPIYPVNA